MPPPTKPKRRGRPANASGTKKPTTSAPADMERRKRPRTSMDQMEMERSVWGQSGGVVRPKKKGKSGRKRKAADQANEARPLAKAGKAGKRGATQTEAGAGAEEEEEEDQARRDAEAQPELKPGSRKRRASGADGDTRPSRAQKKTFQHLAPRTRHISQTTMLSKWAPLNAAAQQQIHEVFVGARRPVLQSKADDKTRIAVEPVLASVLRRLEKKVSRLPFPPKTGEMHFNMEKLLERNRELENRLTPAMHSVELLRAEIEKEEEALERDRALLAELETNAKADQAAQRQRTRKAHPLLRSAKTTTPDDDADSVNMVRGSARAVGLDDVDDAALKPLLDQLRNHVESMQTNNAQVEGVEDALAGAQTAVDEILFKRLDAQQYDRLMAPSWS